MPTNSVLAALTVKLTRQYENAATEALMYVLRTHAPSSAAISELLRHSGLPDDLPRLAFRTQVYGADGSIPDLVGIDASGVERLIVEAKFWAELTDHQPVSYLRRLSESLSSVLLFVCPEKRVQGLWDVLKSRVRPTVAALGCPGGLPQAVTWLKIPPTGHLAIVSWHALLSTLASDAAAQGDRLYESDIHQLEGLCEQVDSEAFLPLHASELSAQTGRRVSQFADLVDAVLVHIKERISRKDLKGSSPRSGSFGKYFLYSDTLDGHQAINPHRSAAGSGFAFDAFDLPGSSPTEIDQCPRDMVAPSRTIALVQRRSHLFGHAKSFGEGILYIPVVRERGFQRIVNADSRAT
jgi:hypothetical protein